MSSMAGSVARDHGRTAAANPITWYALTDLEIAERAPVEWLEELRSPATKRDQQTRNRRVDIWIKLALHHQVHEQQEKGQQTACGAQGVEPAPSTQQLRGLG